MTISSFSKITASPKNEWFDARWRGWLALTGPTAPCLWVFPCHSWLSRDTPVNSNSTVIGTGGEKCHCWACCGGQTSSWLALPIAPQKDDDKMASPARARPMDSQDAVKLSLSLSHHLLQACTHSCTHRLPCKRPKWHYQTRYLATDSSAISRRGTSSGGEIAPLPRLANWLSPPKIAQNSLIRTPGTNVACIKQSKHTPCQRFPHRSSNV